MRAVPLRVIGAWAIGLVVFLRFFSAFKIVLLGFLAATCLAAALAPLRRRVPGPRWIAAFLVGVLPLVLAGATVGLLSWVLSDAVPQAVEHWPETREQIDRMLGTWSDRLGLDDRLTVDALVARAGEFLTGTGTRAFSAAAGTVSDAAIALALVLFGTIFLLGEREGRLKEPLLRLLPARQRRRVRAGVDDLAPRLRRWLLGTLLSMAVVGGASAIGYSLVGVKYAVPLAILAGASEIVPTLGPAATFLVALLLAATQGSAVVVGVVAVYAIVQGIESYLLVPFVMKEAVNIPPVVTLFTVVLWGQIFGLPGLLLAIPLDLVVWSLATRARVLRPS